MMAQSTSAEAVNDCQHCSPYPHDPSHTSLPYQSDVTQTPFKYFFFHLILTKVIILIWLDHIFVSLSTYLQTRSKSIAHNIDGKQISIQPFVGSGPFLNILGSLSFNVHISYSFYTPITFVFVCF